jgi:hypothetical protein
VLYDNSQVQQWDMNPGAGGTAFFYCDLNVSDYFFIDLSTAQYDVAYNGATVIVQLNNMQISGRPGRRIGLTIQQAPSAMSGMGGADQGDFPVGYTLQTDGNQIVWLTYPLVPPQGWGDVAYAELMYLGVSQQYTPAGPTLYGWSIPAPQLPLMLRSGINVSTTQIRSSIDDVMMMTIGAVGWEGVSIRGRQTSEGAGTGGFGEYLTATTPTGITLTDGVETNIISLSLTAGDWDVSGAFNVQFAGQTGAWVAGAVTSTSGALPADSTKRGWLNSGAASMNIAGLPVPEQRFGLSVTTTVYLVASAGFTATASCNGFIRARRCS